MISNHNEVLTKHEELYVVVEGHATFTVDGEEIDAPQGTLVFVGDPGQPAGAVAKEPGTTVLATGARPGHAYEVGPWEESWQENQKAMALYREGKYSDAADLLRTAPESKPDSALLHRAKRRVLRQPGRADAATVAEHLERAIERYPGFRDMAWRTRTSSLSATTPRFRRWPGAPDELRRRVARSARGDRPPGCVLRPVRHQLGITAFGVNARTSCAVGNRLIPEHDESDPDAPTRSCTSLCEGRRCSSSTATEWLRPRERSSCASRREADGVRRGAQDDAPRARRHPGRVRTRRLGSSGPR